MPPEMALDLSNTASGLRYKISSPLGCFQDVTQAPYKYTSAVAPQGCLSCTFGNPPIPLTTSTLPSIPYRSCNVDTDGAAADRIVARITPRRRRRALASTRRTRGQCARGVARTPPSRYIRLVGTCVVFVIRVHERASRRQSAGSA